MVKTLAVFTLATMILSSVFIMITCWDIKQEQQRRTAIMMDIQRQIAESDKVFQGWFEHDYRRED